MPPRYAHRPVPAGTAVALSHMLSDPAVKDHVELVEGSVTGA
jgi:hypothetical protein